MRAGLRFFRFGSVLSTQHFTSLEVPGIDELKQIVRDHQKDPLPYVVTKAKDTAEAIGLK
jgi:hypothetical protein